MDDFSGVVSLEMQLLHGFGPRRPPSLERTCHRPYHKRRKELQTKSYIIEAISWQPRVS